MNIVSTKNVIPYETGPPVKGGSEKATISTNGGIMETFNFKGFTPNDALKIKADRTLDMIMERAPSDARVTATLEQDGEMFHCSIEIGSSSCPFTVETSHKFAGIAVDRAELNLMKKLNRWHGTRFQQVTDAPIRTPLRMAT
jgi:hypothetical protein